MNFKMSATDFQLLSKFVEKKAKGSDLRFNLERDQVLEVTLTLESNEEAKIKFFTEETQSFAKIVRSRNLGDEV